MNDQTIEHNYDTLYEFCEKNYDLNDVKDDENRYVDIFFGPLSASFYVDNDRNIKLIDDYEVWDDDTTEFYGKFSESDLKNELQKLQKEPLDKVVDHAKEIKDANKAAIAADKDKDDPER